VGAGILPQIAAAHALLLRDASIQFHAAAPGPPAPPWWLGPLRRVFKALAQLLAPAFRALSPFGVWILVLVLVLLLIALLTPLTRRWLRSRAPAPSALELQAGLAPPSLARAQALLEDVDRLAAEGRFGEAARALLQRSIQDVEAQRPRSVPRSATAREIARLPTLSPEAQTCFSGIALAVERFAFAGQAMDKTAFEACRALYAEFALPALWREAAPAPLPASVAATR
jgi:hypothetical protein